MSGANLGAVRWLYVLFPAQRLGLFAWPGPSGPLRAEGLLRVQTLVPGLAARSS